MSTKFPGSPEPDESPFGRSVPDDTRAGHAHATSPQGDQQEYSGTPGQPGWGTADGQFSDPHQQYGAQYSQAPYGQAPYGQATYGQAPYGQSPYGQAAAPEAPQRNIVGIIALVCAVLGTIFACIPGAFVVGWILLPLSFVLGLVGVFLKGRKWPAITAIVLSIIGTIVAALVFFFAVGKAIDDAFDSDVTVYQGDETNAAPGDTGGAAASTGGAPLAQDTGGNGTGDTRENPLPIGSTVESKDWAVTLNGVDLNATEAVMAENYLNDEPAPGQTYALANVTITYKGSDPQGATPTEQMAFVFPDGTSVNSFDHTALAPDAIDPIATLYEGGSITGNVEFLVPTAGLDNSVLAIRPDLVSTKKFFAVR